MNGYMGMDHLDKEKLRAELETSLALEKQELKYVKKTYPVLPISFLGTTGLATLLAISNYDSPGAGFLFALAGIFGVTSAGFWYMGHKAVKEIKQNISQLEEELKCL